MKALFDGVCTALSMYSILPAPRVEWNRNTMKYAMACFPLVGACIGAAVFGLDRLLRTLNAAPMLYAALMFAVPVLLSGAIHMDGFVDTCDALFSRRPREEKLQILKDPHVGAFGVVSVCLLCVVSLGLYAQLYARGGAAWLVSFSPVVFRCLSGLSVVCFPMAKETGLAHLFAANADKKPVRIALGAELALVLGGAAAAGPVPAALLAGAAGAWFFAYYRVSVREFGGITGDLAGWFLVLGEFFGLAAAAVGGFLC